MSPFLRYSEILVENRCLNLPHLYLAPPVGVTPLEFRLYFLGIIKLSWAIVWRCLRDSTFSRFDTMPACDRRTDRQTHDDSKYSASIASRANNVGEIAGNDGLLMDKFLLVADEDGDRIVQVDTKTMMTHRQTITVTSQPQVLAYDWLRRDIYWTSGRDRSTIFKYSLSSSETLELQTDITSSEKLVHFVFCC